ncbi:OLC1v1020226C1 [Oldenlandia corymbosa var. corymbosa]|uniref:OLC1v1020226C1 n=1 Tax=Oldenlandia corymbosa var. corymbosa TaxID=529605 RepID=A0AAV1EG01_OLDCO|nr:OLC1v1020226C1 [Oldenlandia corymbosa var. corymbosa]
MNTQLLLHTHPQQRLPSLLPSSSSSLVLIRPLVKPISKPQLGPNSRTQLCFLHKRHHKLRPLIKCAASNEGIDGTKSWEKWVPKDFLVADKVFRWISETTSSPIVQYISSPTTFLHSVDSRIKLAWLLVLVVLPARSHISVRFGLVIFLSLLSVWTQPKQVWMDQLGRVTVLSGILFIMLSLASDSATFLSFTRYPPQLVTGLPNPNSVEAYSYALMKFGPLKMTRKGLSTASTSACLTFTIFQSASLCLTSTRPEQLAFALQWFIQPLKHFGLPVAEVILTLLLSLRFINLVFDEVRNVALGIVSRRINWKLLTTMETIDVFVSYIRRIFRNIFSHSEQISQAMIVRGFRGDCKTHRLILSADASNAIANILSLLCLIGLVGTATWSKNLIL